MAVPGPEAARTLLVANPSADLYGSDRMMLESVRGLVGLGWRVVVTCSQDGPLVAPLTEVGATVKVLPVPVIRKSMLSVRGLIALAGEVFRGGSAMRRLVRRERPDVLLVNTVTIPFWLLVARLCRVPSVVHVHEAESSLSRVARFGLAAPLALANRVVFNSATSRAVSSLSIVERTGRARVVANGVQGPDAITAARERLDDPFRLVYIGRLSPRKGVDLVVRATAALVDSGVDATLDLVGAVFPGYEWYETELRDLVAELGLIERVRFRGFQPRVWSFLAEADVATVASRLDESFGNAVIEALLAARPVVVSDHTGLREAARPFSAAVLTASDDLDAWTAALLDIHEQWPVYRAAAAQDAGRAAELFGPARFHRELAAILAELAGPTAAAQPVEC